MNDPLRESRRKYPVAFLDETLFYFRETREDSQIHAVLKFDGRLDFTRLQRAVRLCVHAQPILGCRLVYHPVAPWWEERDDPGGAEYCGLVSGEDVERSLHAFLTEPLDPFRDPLVRVRVFRGAEDVLAVKASHVLMDGAGFNECLYSLADLYARLRESPELLPAVNAHGTRSLRQVTRRFSLLEKLKIVRRCLRDFKRDGTHILKNPPISTGRKSIPPGDAWGLPLKRGGVEDKLYVLHKIPAHLAERLGQVARTHGATLNDAFLTAYFRAIHRRFAPRSGESMRIRTIANLRRYLPGKECGTPCNLCGYVPVNLGHDPGADFRETLVRVRDLMLRLKSDFIGLGVFPVSIAAKYMTFRFQNWLAGLERYCMAGGFVRPTVKFSNVGEMASERLRFDDLTVMDAYQVGTMGYVPAFTVGITGFKGSWTLSVGICNGSENGPVFRELFDAMEEEMVSAPG